MCNENNQIISVTAIQQPQPNNKITKTVVGLRQTYQWEHHHRPLTTHQRNSKLYDRAEIEQNSENKGH